ncbi:MAG TPA: hypothetical protein VFV47_13170 [Hyphomicrobiaceae bacterium]|nr:hypothetical protein [Hyphomicrobiaceae bacterium]
MPGEFVLEGAMEREVAREIVGPVARKTPPPLLPEGTAQLLDELRPPGRGDIVDLRGPERNEARQVASAIIG